MENIIKKRTLRHFGVDPKGVYRGNMHELYVSDIKDAMYENKMIALIGSFGSGKSTIFDFVEQDFSHNAGYRFVHVMNTNKEKLSINNITDAIIYDLSKESPNRSMEARTRQVTRIMGELHVNRGIKLCVVIENAHRLHANTLMAIKDLRESKYLGRHPLFSVALVGQGGLRNKLEKWEEVNWRTLILDLERGEWMNYQERVNYLKAVYGPAITPDARERIALQTGTPLQMEFYLNEKMDEAMRAGKSTIDGEVIAPSLYERAQALKNQYGLSQRKLADLSGMPPSTLNDHLLGKTEVNKAAIAAAMDKFETSIKGTSVSKPTIKEAI